MSSPASTGTIVGNPTVACGFRLVEFENGPVVLTYVENASSPFRSPVVEERIFDTWSEALNFMHLWNMIRHVQWW